jgi:hypothetical protein
LLYKAKLYLLLSIDRVMPNKKIVNAEYDAPIRNVIIYIFTHYYYIFLKFRI